MGWQDVTNENNHGGCCDTAVVGLQKLLSEIGGVQGDI